MTGKPPDEMLVAAGVVAVLLAFLLPILFPAFLAVRVRPAMPQRIKFVAVAASLSYGFLLLFIVLVSIPLQICSMFVAPVLQQMGRGYGTWLVGAGQALSSYSMLILPSALAIVSVFVSRYLAQRWPRVAVALRG